MKRSELIARVRGQVRAIQRQYYGNSGDAFCHYAFRELFDMDDEEAYEYCYVGGRNDKGIDAFWHDEEERRVVVVQAKYAEQGNARVDRDGIINLSAAYSWLRRLATARVASANDQVVDAARRLEELRRVDPEYPVELYFLCFGKFTPAALEEVEAFNEEHADEGAEIIPIDFADLKKAIEEQLSRRADPLDEPIELELIRHFEFAPADDQPRTIVATIDGRELARIQQKYQYRIFQENVRYYLRANQKVNRSIVQTIQDPEGRERFWYYNNGIAIVCDHYELDDQTEPAVARLINMQIVNGCQTTTTLGEQIETLEESDSPPYVLARIVEAVDEDLQRDITLYNNRQNAVKDRDLMSNDRHQDRLQREFDRLDEPWFYERKRGEWEALAKKQAKRRQRYGRPARRIDNETAAQAAYAFYFDPGEARARKRYLFVPSRDNGYYDRLFNEDTTAEWLLLPFLVFDHVYQKKRAYLTQIKGVNENRASVREKKLLDREWVKFADQVLTGTIGYYMRQRVDFAHDELVEVLQYFDDLIERAYAFAHRDLHLHFRTQLREHHRREEPFSYANYVKGNWSEIREFLDGQWELREDQDEEIFEDIPPLEG